MWFIGVEIEQETSAPPPKKNLDPPLCILGDISFKRIANCLSVTANLLLSYSISDKEFSVTLLARHARSLATADEYRSRS